MEAQAIRDEKPFAAAEEKFHELVERLSSPEAQGLAHGELESLIAAEGREIHRRLLQGHLDLRAAGERVLRTVGGADEVERTHHRRTARGLLTVAGGRTDGAGAPRRDAGPGFETLADIRREEFLTRHSLLLADWPDADDR